MPITRTSRSADPRWLLGIGSLLLVLLFGGLALNDRQAREAVLNLQNENQGKLQALAVQSAQQHLLQQGRLFAATLAADPEVLDLVRQADRWLRQGALIDDEELQPIREQLFRRLTPAWQALQNHRALQLQIYWGKAGISLLRMQDAEAYGDAVANHRPLLYKALHQGRIVSGLDIGKHSVGNRAIAPLRAGDSPDSPVIGALEVGFGILPELSVLGDQLDAGLGILLNQEELEEIFWTRPVGVRLDGLQGWLLQAHSTPQILHWTTQRALLAPGAGHKLQLLEAEGRRFLLNQIPLHDARTQNDSSKPPTVVVLVWRDITATIEEHQHTERQLLMKWMLAWLIAEALLLILGWLLHRRAVIQRQHDTALRDSESRFRSMVSNLPGVVYRRGSDNARTLNYLSTGIERLTGYRTEDFAPGQRSFLSLVHPEDQACLAQEDGDFERTYRLINAKGETLWVQESRRALRDADGRLLWYDGFIWDVTQRVLAEQALRASQEHLSSLYHLAPVGIMLSRLEDGELLDWNSELQRVSGYSAAQLAGCNVRSLLPDPRNGQAAVRQLLQKGCYGPHETELRRQDGKPVPVLLNGTLISEADGSLLVWSIVQDITARVTAERETSEREQYLRLLIANVVDAIVIIDTRGTIETFNHAAEDMFGYGEQEVLGHNLSMLMPESHRSAHDSYLQDYEKHGTGRMLEQNRELSAVRRNGEIFTIELRVSEISHGGERKFIGLLRDITERKRIERMKSDFVSVVSHELRTPLTSISGALGLITGGALGEAPEAMRPMLDIAQQNSLRLELLVSDLLDMDKLAAGQMQLELHTQPLAPLLQEALRTNQGYFKQYGVGCELGELDTALVSVDAHRLQQVLANFLSNAAKFSPPGEVVTLSSQRLGEHIRVSVTDCGPGIPQTFREHVFQKFSQADSSDTRQKGGTGLGLAISKELIEQMQGRIGFDAERTRGACFWFELPVHEASP
ncbi:PAS domain-containing sensor histidine kinase [Stutzerimonas stutzeri]|uniref:PAS domain-containing sensor histidine kinase n=1 Tax=Stutzerimonas stutzeri TaxID=316 RepID=UPI002657EA6D|nr:PAS domain S-box protein [Stutzerimonas stutzeri]MCF6780435.1 PAS domain S-box protein [Stutzerimonas stutzeri]MCF6804628.1 PAS domain S-box protein [Stutzerimonas stutzeri]